MAPSRRQDSPTAKLRRRSSRRRRPQSRLRVLLRLGESVGFQIRTVLRKPLYRWSIGTLASLVLLYWLLGIVLPSTNTYRFGSTQEGQFAR